MNFKQLIKDYFTFSRNERKGITVLLILIFLFIVANKLIFYFETPSRITALLLDSASQKLGLLNDSINQRPNSLRLFAFDPNTIDSTTLEALDLPEYIKLNLLKFRNKGGQIYFKSDFRKIYGVTDEIFSKIEPYLLLENKHKLELVKSSHSELFFFDPNSASNDEFIRLGLSEKQIAMIRRYQSKGGVFRKCSDFVKIRCLTENQRKTLADHVKIIPIENMPSGSKQMVVENIELNSADSILLEKLPGVGAKLSKRIVKYRDLLGGFYSVDQLKEVYGLNEQVVEKIRDMVIIDDAKIQKLDLNFLDSKELSRHPYVQKNLSKRIVEYRTKYGKIYSLKVLCDSLVLNVEEYNRLKPYCD